MRRERTTTGTSIIYNFEVISSESSNFTYLTRKNSLKETWIKRETPNHLEIFVWIVDTNFKLKKDWMVRHCLCLFVCLFDSVPKECLLFLGARFALPLQSLLCFTLVMRFLKGPHLQDKKTEALYHKRTPQVHNTIWKLDVQSRVCILFHYCLHWQSLSFNLPQSLLSIFKTVELAE